MPTESLAEYFVIKYRDLKMNPDELEDFVERFCIADENQALKELMENRLRKKIDYSGEEK